MTLIFLQGIKLISCCSVYPYTETESKSMSTSSSASSSSAAARPMNEDSSDSSDDESMDIDDFISAGVSLVEDEADSSDEDDYEEELTLEERVKNEISKIDRSGYSDIDNTIRKLNKLKKAVFDPNATTSTGAPVLRVVPLALRAQLLKLKADLQKMSEPSEQQPEKIPVLRKALDDLRSTSNNTITWMTSEEKNDRSQWKFLIAYDKIISTMRRAREADISAAKARIEELVRQEEELAAASEAATEASNPSNVLVENAAVRWQAYYKQARDELLNEGIQNDDGLEPLANALARKKFAEANKYNFDDVTLFGEVASGKKDISQEEFKELERQADAALEAEAEKDAKTFENEYLVREELHKLFNSVEITAERAELEANTNTPRIKLGLLRLNETTSRPTFPSQIYSFYVEQLKLKLESLMNKNGTIDILYYGEQEVTAEMIASVEAVINEIGDKNSFLPAEEAEKLQKRGSTRLVTSVDWLETSSNNLADQLTISIRNKSKGQTPVIGNLLHFKVVEAIIKAKEAVKEKINTTYTKFEEVHRKKFSSPSYLESVKRKIAEKEQQRIARKRKQAEERAKARSALMDDSDDSDDEAAASSSSSSSSTRKVIRVVNDSSDDSSDDDEGFVGSAKPPLKKQRRKVASLMKKKAVAKAVPTAAGRRAVPKKNLVKRGSKKAVSQNKMGEIPNVSGLKF